MIQKAGVRGNVFLLTTRKEAEVIAMKDGGKDFQKQFISNFLNILKFQKLIFNLKEGNNARRTRWTVSFFEFHEIAISFVVANLSVKVNFLRFFQHYRKEHGYGQRLLSNHTKCQRLTFRRESSSVNGKARLKTRDPLL